MSIQSYQQTPSRRSFAFYDTNQLKLKERARNKINLLPRSNSKILLVKASLVSLNLENQS